MSDQIADRRAKLEKIRALGVDPYGTRLTDVAQHADIRVAAQRLNIEAGQVCAGEDASFRAAGRVVLYRGIGSLIFLTVRDRTGDLQYGLSKKMVGGAGILPATQATEQQSDEVTKGPTRDGTDAFLDGATGWKVAKLLDLGDIVGVEGQLGRTKTSELTLWVTRLMLLSKCLRPPPEKWHGLTDVEARYRQRHIDLFSNPDSQHVFLTRARIIDYAREVLRKRGFIEVETPVLQPIYGGAAARPFTTHHNTLDRDLYLRISPELYLKRCLVGGLERVYEFSRCFRNEGISPRHNPEFTMLELYQAYGDYHDMMDICEAIIGGAARDVIGAAKIPVDRRSAEPDKREGEAPAEPGSAGASLSQVRVIDYTTPWPRFKYADAFREHVGIAMDDTAAVRKRARELHARGEMKADEAQLDDPVVVHELFDHYVEPKLINPTFVLDWPAPLCPLTRRHPDDPNLALRFELFINGMEIGNAYTELNDPVVQSDTLSRQLRGEEEETMAVMDRDFVEALEYGMPPAGGLGIGIDRAVMLLTGSTSIRDVILFPLQRPQQ
jgi:lysyl-tRNA synthetase class 2